MRPRGLFGGLQLGELRTEKRVDFAYRLEALELTFLEREIERVLHIEDDLEHRERIDTKRTERGLEIELSQFIDGFDAEILTHYAVDDLRNKARIRRLPKLVNRLKRFR